MVTVSASAAFVLMYRQPAACVAPFWLARNVMVGPASSPDLVIAEQRGGSARSTGGTREVHRIADTRYRKSASRL